MHFAVYFDETAAEVGTSRLLIEIMHFGIKFQVGPETQITNHIDFGSNIMHFRREWII